MSFVPDESRRSRRIYQPSFFIKILTSISLIAATFAIPYSLVIASSEDEVSEPIAVETPDDPGTVTSGGVLPNMLTFDEGSNVPASAKLSEMKPFESGWSLIEEAGDVTSYSYTPLNCSIDASLKDYPSDLADKDASLALLGQELNQDIPVSTARVAELTYNLDSTVQVLGVGTQNGGAYTWTYARALSSVDKGIVVSTSCASKEAMFEASDTLRSQFGILVSP